MHFPAPGELSTLSLPSSARRPVPRRIRARPRPSSSTTTLSYSAAGCTRTAALEAPSGSKGSEGSVAPAAWPVSTGALACRQAAVARWRCGQGPNFVDPKRRKVVRQRHGTESACRLSAKTRQRPSLSAFHERGQRSLAGRLTVGSGLKRTQPIPTKSSRPNELLGMQLKPTPQLGSNGPDDSKAHSRTHIAAGALPFVPEVSQHPC
jgi:hypothetical protein